MPSKSLLYVAIIALFLQSHVDARKVGRRIRQVDPAVQRTRFTKVKAPKATPSPPITGGSETPAPSSPAPVPAEETPAPTPTPAPVPAEETPAPAPAPIPAEETPAPAPAPTVADPASPSANSTKQPSNADPELELMNDEGQNATLICAIDGDCDVGWFCMERMEQCCQFNTTCKVTRPNTSSAPASMYPIVASLFSAVALAIILS